MLAAMQKYQGSCEFPLLLQARQSTSLDGNSKSCLGEPHYKHKLKMQGDQQSTRVSVMGRSLPERGSLLRSKFKALGPLIHFKFQGGPLSPPILPQQKQAMLGGEEARSLLWKERVIMRTALQSQQETGWAGMQSQFTHYLIFIFPSWLK